MSGSVQAILGNPNQNTVQLQNPLTMATSYQDLVNKRLQANQIQQETANAQLANQTGQQSLAQTKATRAAQVAFGLSNDPNLTKEKVANAINTEAAQGTIDQPTAQKYLSNLPDDPGQLRMMVNSHLVGQLAGPQAIAAMTPHVQDTDVGGQQVARITPSAIQQIQDPTSSNIFNGSGMNRTLGPTMVSTGGQIVPQGGAYGQQTLNNTLSPGEINSVQSYIDPTTNLPTVARNGQMGGFAPGTVAPGVAGTGGNPNAATSMQPVPQGGYRLPGAGAGQVPQGGQGTGAPTQGGAPGLLANGPASVNPQAQQANADNYKNFASLRDNQIGMKTDESNLVNASNLQKNVVTGPGTDKVQNVRNLISSVSGYLGVPVNQNDIAAGNYDELGKDLSRISAQEGSNAHLASEMESIIHGNPNLMMNRLANSDVLSQMVGQNRQQQMTLAMTKDQQSGRDFAQAKNQASQLDTRALSFDTMTPLVQQRTLQHLKEDPTAYKNFMRSLATYDQYKSQLSNSAQAQPGGPGSNAQ